MLKCFDKGYINYLKWASIVIIIVLGYDYAGLHPSCQMGKWQDALDELPLHHRANVEKEENLSHTFTPIFFFFIFLLSSSYYYYEYSPTSREQSHIYITVFSHFSHLMTEFTLTNP